MRRSPTADGAAAAAAAVDEDEDEGGGAAANSGAAELRTGLTAGLERLLYGDRTAGVQIQPCVTALSGQSEEYRGLHVNGELVWVCSTYFRRPVCQPRLHCLLTAFPCASTAFALPFLVSPLPSHCLSLCIHDTAAAARPTHTCLSLAARCRPLRQDYTERAGRAGRAHNPQSTGSPRAFIFSVENAVCKDSYRLQRRRNRLPNRRNRLPTLTSVVRILSQTGLTKEKINSRGLPVAGPWAARESELGHCHSLYRNYRLPSMSIASFT